MPRYIPFWPFWLAILSFGCVDTTPPILFVPANASLRQDEYFALVSDALARQGYRVLEPNPQTGAITTEWVYRNDWIGQTRRRVLVRISRGPASGLAVSVPVEYLERDRWVLNGEDEETRQRVVAALLARMQARSGGR